MDWFIIGLASLAFVGVQEFLFKVSAAKKCDSAITSFTFALTAAIVTTILFLFSSETISNPWALLWIGLLNSSTFLLYSLFGMESLKYLPLSTVFPIIKLNLVGIVILSMIIFGETISLIQIGGIILAILAVIYLAREAGAGTDPEGFKHKHKKHITGLIYAFIASFGMIGAMIALKFAEQNVGVFQFIAFSSFLNAVFAYLSRGRFKNETAEKTSFTSIKIGVAIGLVNIGGFTLFMKGLEAGGPLSIMTAIGNLSFVIAIILSMIIYRERLNRRRVLGVLIAITALILLRM